MAVLVRARLRMDRTLSRSTTNDLGSKPQQEF
jgi:hypothetical protein